MDLARTHWGAPSWILPDVPTWWCGEPAGMPRSACWSNWTGWSSNRPFHRRRATPCSGATSPGWGREAMLRERIAVQPVELRRPGRRPAFHRAGLEWPAAVASPGLVLTGLRRRDAARVFAVMPGGLTRTSPSQGQIVSMQQGGGSKDTWVMGLNGETNRRAAPSYGTRIVALPQTNLRRPTAGELPSRVADSLFWVGRYAERTDNAVRLPRTLLTDGYRRGRSPWRFRDAEPIPKFRRLDRPGPAGRRSGPRVPAHRTDPGRRCSIPPTCPASSPTCSMCLAPRVACATACRPIAGG